MKIAIISQKSNYYRDLIRETYQNMSLETACFETLKAFMDAENLHGIVIVDNEGLQHLEEDSIRRLIAYCREREIDMIIAEDAEDRFFLMELDALFESKAVFKNGQSEQDGNSHETEDLFKNGKRIERVVDKGPVRESCSIQEKVSVGVIGLSDHAGASFLVLNLAKAISDCGLIPAVVELGKGSIYDAIGMEKRFTGRQFHAFHKAVLDGEKIRNRHNLDEGINWILQEPQEGYRRLSTGHMQRLINNVIGDVILCDFSGLSLQNSSEVFVMEVLKDMDAVIAVIDPLPSRLIPGCSLLALIGRELRQAIYVINKNNKGIDRYELMRFLKLRKSLLIPIIPQEEIYSAEYRCQIPYCNAAVKKLLKEPFREIIRRIIPPEMLKI